MTFVFSLKSLLQSVVFLCIAIIAMLSFARAHKAASPMDIELNAYKGILLELVKILKRISGAGLTNHLPSNPGIHCVHGIVGIKYETTPDKGKAGKFDPIKGFTKGQNSKKEVERWRNILHETDGCKAQPPSRR